MRLGCAASLAWMALVGCAPRGGEAPRDVADAACDARGDGAALYREGAARRARGDVAGAERCFDRAIAALSRATGARLAVDAALGGTSAVAFRADGGALALAQGDAVSLREVGADGAWIETARAACPASANVVLAADGRRVAASCAGVATLIDVSTPSLTRAVAADAGGVQAIALSRDGATLAVMGEREASLVDAATGARRVGLPARAGGRVAFTRRGDRVATAGGGSVVPVWDVATGARVAALEAHDHPGGDAPVAVHDAVFSIDGRELIGGTTKGDVEVWDVASGAVVREIHAGDAVFALALSDDGARLAAVVFDEAAPSRVLVWDLAGDAPPRAFATGANVHVARIAFTPDGASLVICGASDVRVVRLADGAQAWPLRALPRYDRAVAFALGDGALVVAGSADRSVGVFSDDLLHAFDGGPGVDAVVPLAGSRFATRAADGVRIATPDDAAGGTLVAPSRVHGALLDARADGGALAVAVGNRTTIGVWDPATRTRVQAIDVGPEPVAALAFCGDELAANQGARVRVWQAARLAPRTELPVDGKFACSTDGATYASVRMVPSRAGCSQFLELWRRRDERAVGRVELADCANVDWLAFTGDAVLVGDRRSLASFDAVTLARRASWPPLAALGAYAVTRDGRAVASAQYDAPIVVARLDGSLRLALVRSRRGDAAAAVSLGPTPRVELFGPAADAARLVVCRFGALSFPYELCRARVESHGLVAAALHRP